MTVSTPPTEEAQAAALDAATALFGVPMQPAWRTVALASLATVAVAAQLVMEFPLDDETEYAPVFHP